MEVDMTFLYKKKNEVGRSLETAKIFCSWSSRHC